MANFSSSNNIGAFLSTVNLGAKSSSLPAADSEALGKQVLNVLSERGQATTLELGQLLNLPSEQVDRVVDFLREHDMAVLEQTGSAATVRLTSFAQGAMQVFKLG